MYFHISKGIYISYFNNEFVVLDIYNDKYHILSQEVSSSVVFALDNEFKLDGDKYVSLNPKTTILLNNFNDYVKYLIDLRILSWNNHIQPYTKEINKAKHSSGAANLDWNMPKDNFYTKTNTFVFLEAYVILIKVYALMNIFGFRGLIKAIQYNADKNCKKVNPEEFQTLVSALNKACFFFPVRTKCLEWSGALILLGLKRKFKCNIEIGVQTIPFLAHAWVRAGDMVIADSQDLPQTLSIILSEPFN